MIHAGTTVAILQGKTILLTLREDFEVWCLPGGEIEAGESLADSARREVREETGLEVELTRLVGTYSRIGWHDDHDFLFTARITGGSLQLDPHEVLDARFFPFDALPKDTLIGEQYRLQDAISGACGIVRSEYVAAAPSAHLSRAEIYRQRDDSSLSRREFYFANVPALPPEQVKIEVPGVTQP